MRHHAAHLLLLAALPLACGDGQSPRAAGSSSSPSAAQKAQPGAGDPGQASPAPDEAPAVELAEAPRIDLLHNRYRFHLYLDGLLVPFAAEGFRKYTQEYRRPWKRIVDHDGRPGRVLDQRSAVLRIPWHQAGAATVRLWLHGLAGGQRVQVDVNGKRAGIVSAGAEWAEHTVSIPDGLLREGENEIRLFATAAGTAGGQRSFGLYHALEIVPGDAGPSGRWPPLSPAAAASAGGAERQALTGFPRVEIYLEVPERAWLDLSLGADGEASFRVSARAAGAPARPLLEAKVSGGWKRHTVSLADLGGELVALELAVEGDGAFGEPAIALEAAPVRERPPAYENLMLVVVDALRSDRLSVYRDTRVVTPRMTAEADRRGAVFLNNQAASPSSPPSHGSIQTGMIPRVHGVVGDAAQLKPDTPMISTQLRAAGVVTAYFGNNPFGMGRLEKPGRWDVYRKPRGIDCTILIDEMLDFAREQSAAGKRFFVSSLPYEPHTPYRFHEGISDKFWKGPWGPPVGKSVDGHLLSALSDERQTLTDAQWQQLFALYDGEVEYWDRCFGRLVDGLAEIGVADETAIVLTSDHGEGMFEHGRMGHAFGHYAELADIPLIVYSSRLNDSLRKIDTVSSQLDIAPTVLDMMGVTPDRRIQGESLVPVILREGPWTPRVLPLEYGRSYALKARRWKLIVDYQGNESVFDHGTDPTEQKDLAGTDHFGHRYLRDMAGVFLAHREHWLMPTWGTLNDHGPAFVEYIEKNRP
jgi:arylsulfatase A-like enzyme